MHFFQLYSFSIKHKSFKRIFMCSGPPGSQNTGPFTISAFKTHVYLPTHTAQAVLVSFHPLINYRVEINLGKSVTHQSSEGVSLSFY